MNPKPIDQSAITLHASGGMTVAGRDAMSLYRAITLRQALDLYERSGMRMTRSASPAFMLALATEYTGKPYKRGQYAQASADLGVWIDTMRAGMVYVDERTEVQS